MLGIVAVFQNEGKILKEWLEYHILIGVEKFYLLNNSSNDNCLDILQSYISRGMVELSHNPRIHKEASTQIVMQATFYRKIVRRRTHKWLALIDIDEFIVLKKHNNLIELLLKYENYGGLSINWQMFGTSNVQRYKLCTEDLIKKAENNNPVNKHVKTIIQPQKVKVADIHNCVYRHGNYSVLSDGTKVTGPIAPKVYIEDIQINHYWSQDIEFLENIKIPRRILWHLRPEDTRRIANQEYNMIEDKSIHKFLPVLRSHLL